MTEKQHAKNNVFPTIAITSGICENKIAFETAIYIIKTT